MDGTLGRFPRGPLGTPRKGVTLRWGAGQKNAIQSGLSYESLTEGFMTEGETVTAFMIDYTSIDTWEYGREGDTKKTLPAGKALVLPADAPDEHQRDRDAAMGKPAGTARAVIQSCQLRELSTGAAR